jgi:hypothetical protein
MPRPGPHPRRPGTPASRLPEAQVNPLGEQRQGFVRARIVV